MNWMQLVQQQTDMKVLNISRWLGIVVNLIAVDWKHVERLWHTTEDTHYLMDLLENNVCCKFTNWQYTLRTLFWNNKKLLYIVIWRQRNILFNFYNAYPSISQWKTPRSTPGWNSLSLIYCNTCSASFTFSEIYMLPNNAFRNYTTTLLNYGTLLIASMLYNTWYTSQLQHYLHVTKNSSENREFVIHAVWSKSLVLIW